MIHLRLFKPTLLLKIVISSLNSKIYASLQSTADLMENNPFTYRNHYRIKLLIKLPTTRSYFLGKLIKTTFG